MAKGRVELTESARKKAEKAGLLPGSGKVAKEGREMISRQSRGRTAQNAALKALGVRRKNQTTDSNN